VPERREERTTEGGLDVVGQQDQVGPFVRALGEAGIRVSLFIAPDITQVTMASALGAPVVELHTGQFCEAIARRDAEATAAEFQRILAAAEAGADLGLEVHAGHGINYESVGPIARIPQVVELNIGHFLVGEAIFTGLAGAVGEMRRRMDAARAGA